MLTFICSSEARGLGITNAVLCVVSDFRISDSGAQLALRISELETRLRVHADEILARPEALGFSKLFERLGYPLQVPAGKRLVDGIRTRGFKRINNIVDAYNIVSAENACGIGMHDAGLISAEIRIFRSSGSETIVPFGKTARYTVPAGDIVYGYAGTEEVASYQLLAALGKRDVDSETHKITHNTTSALLVALGNEDTTGVYNRQRCLDVYDLIRIGCPSAKIHFLNENFNNCRRN